MIVSRHAPAPAIPPARLCPQHAQGDTESELWQALRGRRLGNLKFRRQVPLNGYIPDFVCFEAGIIVELDGSQHLGRCPAGCAAA